MTIDKANNPSSYNIWQLFIQAMRSNTDKPKEFNIARGQRVKIIPELERIKEFRNLPIHADFLRKLVKKHKQFSWKNKNYSTSTSTNTSSSKITTAMKFPRKRTCARAPSQTPQAPRTSFIYASSSTKPQIVTTKSSASSWNLCTTQSRDPGQAHVLTSQQMAKINACSSYPHTSSFPHTATESNKESFEYNKTDFKQYTDGDVIPVINGVRRW